MLTFGTLYLTLSKFILPKISANLEKRKLQILEKNINIEWLLNYRGGSFLIDYYSPIAQECRIRGVSFNRITANGVLDIYTEIEQNNMDIILLEKAPRIAIYTPQNKQPWDDAVTLALTLSLIHI